MSSESKVSSPQLKAVTESESDVEMKRVREILFGQDFRALEIRMADFEVRMEKSSQALKETIIRRLELIEGFVRNELDALGERTQAERTDRTSSFTELSRGMERLEKDQKQARRDLLENTKRLTDELTANIHDVIQTAEKSFERINQSKVDRTHLAKVLNDLANDLAQNDLPKKEPRKTA